MKDDKSLLITLVWLVITLVLIGWVTYQSWSWFFTEKNPITNNSIMWLQEPLAYPEFRTFEYAVQKTVNPQPAASGEFVQIDRIGLPFNGDVCEPITIDACK